jgi:hypothetical protein
MSSIKGKKKPKKVFSRKGAKEEAKEDLRKPKVLTLRLCAFA